MMLFLLSFSVWHCILFGFLNAVILMFSLDTLYVDSLKQKIKKSVKKIKSVTHKQRIALYQGGVFLSHAQCLLLSIQTK